MNSAAEHTCMTCETPLPSASAACPACVTAELPARADPRAETAASEPPLVSPDAVTLTPSPLPFPARNAGATPSPLPFPHPGSDTDMLLGLVFGDCLLQKKIGQGGMGAIYQAHHQALDRQVVVKILPPTSTTVEEYRVRFVREAQAAARLSHPNVVHVYNVGEARGLLFYVMELIEGESLDALCMRGPTAPLKAVRLIRDAALGLGAAHDEGIIHRDVKAANILVSSKGEVKVTDFGVAFDLTKERLSGSGMLLGTPAYMAPEQARGAGDARSDLYSLGVTLFQLLTTKLPFDGDTFLKILEQHSSTAAPSPRIHVADTPTSVCRLVEKLLDKDPARRYASVGALVTDLDAVIAELEGNAPPARIGDPPPSKLPLVVGAVGIAALLASWQWGRPAPPPVVGRTAAIETRSQPSLRPVSTDPPTRPKGVPLTLVLETDARELLFASSEVRFTVGLEGDAPADLELLADGSPVLVTDGLASVAVSGLREGQHVIRLSARSGGAEVAALGVAVTVDLTPPALTLNAPPPGEPLRLESLGANRSLTLICASATDSVARVSARFDVPGAAPPVTLVSRGTVHTGSLSVRPTGKPGHSLVGRVPLILTAVDTAGNVLTLRSELLIVPAGMQLVAGGPFRTGSSAPGGNSPPRSFETSAPFFVDTYEVTNARYQVFVDAGGGSPPRSPAWSGGHYRDGFASHPVQGVSFLQATRFAEWSGARLPTEVEWEKAAAWNPQVNRNTRYPWGPGMQPEWANTQDYWVGTGRPARATPVGQFPRDKSPAGCYDMGGNVQEWAAVGDDSRQTLKGGCYLNRQAAASTTRREPRSADATLEQVGFRCARDLTLGEQLDP